MALNTASPQVLAGIRVLDLGSFITAPYAAMLLAEMGADVVITGRVADPALFLAPLVHEFGWSFDDWQRMGQGIVIGHLLECAAQITGDASHGGIGHIRQRSASRATEVGINRAAHED